MAKAKERGNAAEFIVRTHYDEGTIDSEPMSFERARLFCEWLIFGAWDGLRWYPPHRIVCADIVEKKS